VPAHDVLFGASLGQWNGADAADAAGRIRLGTQADRDGLDLFTVADHPYFGDKLDAYALTGFLLGRTERITGMVAVTNLPSRPAPVLARTLTSLSALSGGRIILGIGAGAIWDMITKLGVPRLDGGAAVRAMAEAITLVRALSGGGDPVTFDGEFYHVDGLDPAAAPAPRVFTGSVGPKSLAVTGQLADGWIPPGGSDWLSELYRESRPRVDAAASAAGRDPAEIVSVYNGRYPRRRGPGPLGHRDRPRRPRSHHPVVLPSPPTTLPSGPSPNPGRPNRLASSDGIASRSTSVTSVPSGELARASSEPEKSWRASRRPSS
jgi:hypothetical protein